MITTETSRPERGRLTLSCLPDSCVARGLVEEAFGWIKTIAGQGKTKFRGLERVGWSFTFAAAAYNLIRLPKLLQTAT